MSELGDFFTMAETISRSGADRWGGVATVAQNREDRLPVEDAVAKWQQIYALFGATGESMRDEVFAAVNGYFAVNGCSPYGKYSREVKTAGGIRVGASELTRITGRLEGDIRQFLRGRLKESYESLKHSRVLKDDEAALAKAEASGIPRHLVHLLADWLRHCEFLTPEEEDIYTKVSSKNITDARERRVSGRADEGKRGDLLHDEPSVVFDRGGLGGQNAVSY